MLDHHFRHNKLHGLHFAMPFPSLDVLIVHTDVPLPCINVPLRSADVPLRSNDAPLCSNDAPLCSDNVPLCSNDTPLCSDNVPLCSNDTPLCSNDTPLRSFDVTLESFDLMLACSDLALAFGDVASGPTTSLAECQDSLGNTVRPIRQPSTRFAAGGTFPCPAATCHQAGSTGEAGAGASPAAEERAASSLLRRFSSFFAFLSISLRRFSN